MMVIFERTSIAVAYVLAASVAVEARGYVVSHSVSTPVSTPCMSSTCGPTASFAQHRRLQPLQFADLGPRVYAGSQLRAVHEDLHVGLVGPPSVSGRAVAAVLGGTACTVGRSRRCRGRGRGSVGWARQVLSLRGGESLFPFRRTSEANEPSESELESEGDSVDPERYNNNNNEDADEAVNELYELSSAPDNTFPADVEGLDTAAANNSTVAAGGIGATASSSSATTRTVEVKATSRHLFGKPFRSLEGLIPISCDERSQFFAMSTMMFLFIYVFTTVRDTKDTLVVSHCGAEAIPFLKLYGVMPCAALFLVLYSRASNVLGREALFYVTLVPFFLFYSIFAFVLYPNRNGIHFLPKAGGEVTPGPFSLIRYWSYSLYFIVSELWASSGVPLLFWQCANDVSSLSQAKRFYPLFAVFGNLAPIISGKVMSLLVSLQKTNDDAGFQSTLQGLAVIKAAICLGIIALYHLVYDLTEKRTRRDERKRVSQMLTDAKEGDMVEVEVKFGGKSNKRKGKPTIRDSVAELSKSWELKAVATMVICYNTCIELTEVLWKALLRKTYTNKSAYMDFMATFSQTVGWVTIVMQLLASSIIRGIGWKGAAMLVPISMVVLAIWFFSSVTGAEEGRTTLATALLVGTLQNIVSKVTKYSLFDPCKEMAYIPLSPEAKVKGKAAVEVFGARLGRSIGSASQQLLVLASGGRSIIQCAPALGVLYVTAFGFWSSAVWSLGRLFNRTKDETEDIQSGLTGLVHVRVDSKKGKIVSVEAGRS